MISLKRLPTITNVEESWNQMKDTTRKAVSATLGVAEPGKWYINRNTWFWNDGVEMKVRERKRLYHKLMDDQMLADWQIYYNANREPKKAIAASRVGHYKNLYDKLDTQDSERDLYRLAKSRNERTGYRRAATNRWREYFEQVSIEKFAHSPLPQSLPKVGAVTSLSNLTP